MKELFYLPLNTRNVSSETEFRRHLIIKFVFCGKGLFFAK